MEIKKIKENELKMILGFSIPSIIAMLLETIITITDGYFTGNYSVFLSGIGALHRSGRFGNQRQISRCKRGEKSVGSIFTDNGNSHLGLCYHIVSCVCSFYTHTRNLPPIRHLPLRFPYSES